MADRVVLHIGTMKSGTSFVQNVLKDNRAQLLDDGLLFPGARWRHQVLAVEELIKHGGKGQPPMPVDGWWAKLVEEIRVWPGTAVISMEFLAPRTTEQIKRIRRDFRGTRLDVLITCRDLGRNVPAMWLESVQNGAVVDWETYVADVEATWQSQSDGVRFWRHQHVPDIARRWAKATDRGSVTLLTVPSPGAPNDLLWRRFAGYVGITADNYQLDVRKNPGIGLPSAMVLLHLNQLYRSRAKKLPGYYDRMIKHGVAKRGLATSGGDEPRLGFDAPWVQEAGAHHVEQLRKARHRVIGDLEELRPVAVRGVQPAELTAAQLLGAAATAIDLPLAGWEGQPGLVAMVRSAQVPR